MSVGDEAVAHAVSVLSGTSGARSTSCCCGGLAVRTAPRGGDVLRTLLTRMDGASAWRCLDCLRQYSPFDPQLPARGRLSIPEASSGGGVSIASRAMEYDQ